MLGVVFCVAGALCMSFYQGAVVFGTIPAVELEPAEAALSSNYYTQQALHFSLNQFGITSWQFGSLCLLIYTLCAAIFINLQVMTTPCFASQFPLLKVTAGCVTIQGAYR